MGRMWPGAVCAMVLVVAGAAAAQDAQPTLYQPAVSPDGSEIAFVSGGEIWTVHAAGGVARILIAHEADEGEHDGHGQRHHAAIWR